MRRRVSWGGQRVVCILGAALSLVNVAAAEQQPQTTAFIEVTVISMLSETPAPNQVVIVENGKIQAVGQAGQVTIPQGASRVEGQGKFLLPGLTDMHVHLAPSEGNANDPAGRQLKLFLIHGVTTVRGMVGLPGHVALRERIAKGEVLGPTLVCAGPPLHAGAAPNPSVAVAKVLEQSQQGFDLVMVHEGLSPETYHAIVTTAERERLPIAGHVTATVGLQRALAARQTSIEHLDGYLRQSIPSDAPVSVPPGQIMLGEALDHVQDEKLADWAAQTQKAGVWNTPTLVLFERIVSGSKPEDLLKLPEMKFVPAPQRAQFAQQADHFAKIMAPAERRQKFVELRRKAVQHLDRAGAGLLVGSDSPQFFLVEGSAAHNEFKSLVAAGLSPYKALQAATCNAGEHLGSVKGGAVDADAVEVGRRADLVLLSKSPLDDIQNLSSIEGVMVRALALARPARCLGCRGAAAGGGRLALTKRRLSKNGRRFSGPKRGATKCQWSILLVVPF